jgi:hypothetical protein
VHILALATLFLLSVPPVCATPPETPGDLPVQLKIEPEKSPLLPGELIDVTLSEIRDYYDRPAHSAFRIVVRSGYGEILGGVSLTPPEGQSPPAGQDGDAQIDLVPLLPPAKVFTVGDGTLVVGYRAPLYCPTVPRDRITVENSRDLSDDVPFEQTSRGDVIGETTIRLSCPDIIIADRTSYMHSADSSASSTKDIEVRVRVVLEPGQAPNLYRITSAEVLSFSGREILQDSDGTKVCTLVRATPKILADTVQLWPDFDEESIRGITFSGIQVDLEWTGDLSMGPDDRIMVAPVTDVDQRDDDDRLAQELGEMAEKMKGGSLEDMSDMMNLVMGNIEMLTVPKDHVVYYRDSESGLYRGKGRREGGGPGLEWKEAYHWTLTVRR